MPTINATFEMADDDISLVSGILPDDLNSQGTEIFPFSYFAFSMLKLIKVMKDIKNINTFEETRTGGLDFG